MRYVVVLERTEDNYGAYVPDLPGCVVVGETRAETLKLIREAIALHMEGMRAEGLAIPKPSATSQYVEVVAA